MELLNNIVTGFAVALSPWALLYCFIGVTLGTFVGVLPGIGPLVAISLLLPVTFSLDATSALIMLAGIYFGTAYGGSTASILLNLPGTPSAAVACLDGYPMSRQGRAGVALFMTTIASFVGSFVGLVALVVLAPPIATIALSFGSPEYFSLMVLGLLAAALLSSRSPFKALSMVCIGVILGIVGTDVSTGLYRFTYGQMALFEGLPLVAVALGIFGLSEVINNAGQRNRPVVHSKHITLRAMIPTADDWRRSWGAMLRGTAIGSFLGALPGAGGLLASFVSYATEKRVNKDPSRLGRGAIEGVAGPEAANNAAVQTAFIPTLTLGIPGDIIMAVLLGALIIHGIVPGTALLTKHPEMFWGLVASFFIGNVILVLLNIPLIGLWVRILAIPYSILYPFIIAFICIGVYSVNNSVVDLYVLLGFGVLGIVLFFLRFEPAPLILGLILGPMLEENLRRSLTISRGNFLVFLNHPISAAFLMVALLTILWTIYSLVRNRRQPAEPAQPTN